MNKKAERAQATRDQLIAIATRLFAEHGYEGASVEAVLQDSGLSRGALYHHFAGKEALFEAVLESVEADISRKVIEATAGLADPMAALREGCLAWIRLAGDPVVRRIVLVDAPSVIGWQRWREVEERYAFGMLKAALEASAGPAGLRPALIDPFAHMLLASVNEIALVISRADDTAAATRMGEAAIDELLRRLFGAGG
jgi:AcrR family transcriptional regulator